MSMKIVENQEFKPLGDTMAIDTMLSLSSENAVQNKVLAKEFARINTDLSELTANVKGIAVTLDTTTYTATSDGYLVTSTNAGGFISVKVADSQGTSLGWCNQGTSDSFWTSRFTFIRKGMQLYVGQQTGNASAQFIPLVTENI